MARLRHLRALPPPGCSAGLQRAGRAAGRHVHPCTELVAGVCPAVCCGRPQHLLHGHRVHPVVSGEREASGGAAAAVGADGAQPEARVRGAAVPETGRAGAGQRPLVRPHRLSPLHLASAADDPSLPRQLSAGSGEESICVITNMGAGSTLNQPLEI